MKRLILFLMITLTAGILPSWSGGILVYRELTRVDTYQPKTGDRLIIPNDACAVDMRYLDHSVTVSLDVSQVNPNCLFFLNGQDKIPEGLDDNRNVIIDNAIDELIIHRDYPYWSPYPFKAATALFIYTPRNEMIGGQQPEAGVIQTGTLVLPFDAERAWLLDVNGALGVEIPSSSEALNINCFEGFKDGKLLFRHVDVNQLKGNEPYLISSMLSSPIVFYAEDVIMEISYMPIIKSSKEGNQFGYQIVASTLVLHSENAFHWNYLENCFSLCNGETPAFSAIISVYEPGVPGSSDGPGGQPGTSGGQSGEGQPVTPGSSSGIDNDRLEVTIINEAEPTGISTVASRGVQRVYTLSGQRLSTSDKSGLRPGIYIIGGRKVVVK